MRSRVRIAGAAASVGLVLLVAAAVALTSREQPVALPNPSPTPSPSPSPSPTPTVAVTVGPTARPRPTTNAAGQQLMTYYFQIRATFPIFPPTPRLDFDEPAGETGDAWYRGINAAGQPIFAVREDFVMTPSTAFHELGHAYQDLVQRQNAASDVMAKYRTYRGFPGTWQSALTEANAQPVGMAQWIHLPGESWAESFSVAMVGGGREKTLDYGRTINPVAMKAWFVSLMPPAP